MDVVPSTSRGVSRVVKQHSPLEIELYYLIAKFLATGPCKKAYKVLVAEIEENQLLPKRCDWLGNEHVKSFREVEEQNIHISPEHLLKIVARIGPALDQVIQSNLPCANTLLGAGTQSLLRTEKDFYKLYGTISSVLLRRYGRPLLEPKKVKGPPNFIHCFVSRELCGSFNAKHVLSDKLYSRFQLFSRSVAHLSAIYCMLFDRSGKYIITGADDTLVKLWSTLDGRLVGTLRGCSAEISDIAIDIENTLIAAGSCDKIIRVWSLQTLSPLAVLSSHTGMITALQFCPAPDEEGVLVSTGGDGCVAFWTYKKKGKDVKFDPKPLKLNERVRPGNAQLICASFSHGGHFLALGGADHFVRVYRLGGEDGVDKLIETEIHQDRVDSIQWCSRGLKFVSGSRDGTALVWRYERQQWKYTVLNMSVRLSGDPPPEEPKKLQVTMVGWDKSDDHVITASNDRLVRVWNSETGQLQHILRGHEDNVYVIEAHPKDGRLILTAGHDGQLFIWDIFAGTQVKSFKNTIEGQGYGALFDAKWSPDGLTIAATDSHGHLNIFGVGHNEKFKRIPKELFFHTDYRPVMRDANNHILDEQTQMAPHLMPPPFLVNMDGDPYPPEFQRLVPGRENCVHEQLIPNVILNADGDQEVVDTTANNSFPVPQAPQAPQASLAPAAVGSSSGSRPSIDEMIQRLAHEQDQRLGRQTSDSGEARGEVPGPSNVQERRESRERRASASGPPGDHSYAAAANQDPISPRGSRVGARRVGDVEGVRQSTGNWQRDPNMKWSRRVIVRELRPGDLRNITEERRALGELETNLFLEESKKKPEPPRQSPQKQEPMKKTKKKYKKQTHSYSTRSNRDSPRGSNYRKDEIEDQDAAVSQTQESSDSGSSSGTEVENDELEESSSSDEESTDYSDWTADAGVNLEPPKRTAHKQKKSPPKRKRRKKKGSEDDDDDDDDVEAKFRERNENKDPEERTKARTSSRLRKLPKIVNGRTDLDGALDEIPEAYRPPEWLTETYPKKAPYFPQMGDKLVYFMQGHMLYVEAVMNRKLYTADKRNLPWMRTKNKLRYQEFVKIIGIKYEIKPPRLCCLKLGILDPGSGAFTGDSFTIKYHDMPDVLDFLILKDIYDQTAHRLWEPNKRFRCVIDDAWWFGTVIGQEPHLQEFPDSLFMCYKVRWDNGEEERLSPWDMEYPGDKDNTTGDCEPIEPGDLENFCYKPTPEDWAGGDMEVECDRISSGIEKVMGLAIAEPYLVPVDLNVYPMYAMIVDYPMDLTTIKSRLDNRFYRRLNAAQFDVRYIATNAEKFNKSGTNIVRQGRIVTELCLAMIKDRTCYDPTPLYHDIQANYHSTENSATDDDKEDLDGEGPSNRRKGSGKIGRPRKAKVDERPWQLQCRDLLKSIFEREDSMPFRYPVDLDRYPDYSQVIDVPMDLTTVREELATGVYETPHDFAKDVRLIFVNSKNYNTNKRSRIYSMTLRMEAYFEDQLKPILSNFRGKGSSHTSAVNGFGSDSAKSGAVGTSRSIVSGTRRMEITVPSYMDHRDIDTEDMRIKMEESDSDEADANGMRRSRRVAKLKRLQGSDFEEDSGEEYSPNSKRKCKKLIKSIATRNRGKGKIHYGEESEDELPAKKKTLQSSRIKREVVESDEESSSDDSDSDRASTLRSTIAKTNGHKSVGVKKESSDSDSDDSSNDIDEQSARVKKPIVVKKTKTSGVNGGLTKKRKLKKNDSEGSESSDECWKSSRTAISKGKPKTLPKPVPKRRTKEESEVEFDEDELDETTEESEEEESSPKRGRKRGGAVGVGVASCVRRARKVVLDGDDDADDDFIVDDDFIDDEGVSEEESTSDSEDDSEDSDVPRTSKKKSKSKKTKKVAKKTKSKAVSKKKKVVKGGGKKKPSPKKKNPNTKKKKTVNKKAKVPAKKTGNKANKALPRQSVHEREKRRVQELITVDAPGRVPIPYKPIPAAGQTVREVKHKGKVIGRMISSVYDDYGDDDESEESEESSDDEIPVSSKKVQVKSAQPQIGKRSFESDSDDDRRKGKTKRTRVIEEDDDEEEEEEDEEEEEEDEDDDEDEEIVNVSSRGRIRKANSLMRDFIS